VMPWEVQPEMVAGSHYSYLDLVRSDALF
jgi:hypothetical protein